MKTLWRLRLCFWLAYYGYVSWKKPIEAWQWTGDEAWLMYYEDDYSPKHAVWEDASYG